MVVFVINGYPRSGKDTVVDILKNDLGYSVHSCSTIDTVKKAAELLGWRGEKTPHMRNFLSALKDLYTEYLDGPFNEVVNIIKYHVQNPEIPVDLITVMCREPSEIQKIMDWCQDNNIACFSIIVKRPLLEENDHNNTGDSFVKDFDYDIEILNDSSLEELKQTVSFMMSVIQTYL